MSNGGVMLSGWLRKSPPERKLRRNAWKKRWFVLRSGRLSGDPNVLEYFRHQGSKKPIRAISLNECSQIDANVPIKYEKKDPAQQYVFDIVTKTRTYYLVADTSLEMASWVRYLCDLCGFNHDSPENQADLGSQQQTFKAVQPIPGRNFPPGVTDSLLNNEAGTPVGSEVPIPLPRPQNTITRHSVPIPPEPVDANGNIQEHNKSLVDGSTSTSSTASGRVSVAGTPDQARKLASGEKNGYSFAVEPALAVSSSEYVLLADCNTAPVSEDPPDDPSLLCPKFSERRTSTDSVFTHDGAISDCPSDVMTDQPATSHAAHLRYISANMKKQRLDSMPDMPPPLPPNKVNNRPTISRVDEMGYSYPPDDEDDDVDDVREARKRSVPASYGLSPIDDNESINCVPLNLQQEYGVDEMGIPLAEGAHRSGSFISAMRNLSAATSAGTEYINTADASSEVGVGNYPGSQRFPVAGKPFLSPTNRTPSSQHSASSVFAPYSEQSAYSFPRQIYDVPKPMSPQHQSNFAHYSSPRHHAGLYNSKNSLYSSATTLSPPQNQASPQRFNNFAVNSAIGLPKMRRSSSVGQLETVANELAAKTSEHSTPTHMRRRSIDHRTGGNPIYNIPSSHPATDMSVYSSPTRFANVAGDMRPKSGAPPPRPPKSEMTVKQSMNDWSQQESENRVSSTSTDRSGEPPVSPVHTKVISTDIPDSPQHTEVITVFDDFARDSGVNASSMDASPFHSTIVKTVPISSNPEPSPLAKSPAIASSQSPKLSPTPQENGLRSVNSSCSSGSGATSDSSRSRSPSTLYDVPRSRSHSRTPDSAKLPEINDPASVYDTPRSNLGAEVSSVGQRRLAEIEDSKHQSYEPMRDQTEPFPGSRNDDMSVYTTMAGATNLIGHGPISAWSSTDVTTNQKPPPVKRDLKPGRCSLGSDGGTGDSRSYPLRASGDDSILTNSDLSSPNSSSHLSDSAPVSPPHTMLIHSMPPSPAVMRGAGYNTMPSQGHLHPPERPPKNPSQSSLSPRTPPSTAMSPGRPYGMGYGPDRGPGRTHKGGAGTVPGRPPKPVSMQTAGGGREDFPHSARTPREFPPARPPKSAFSNEFDSSHFAVPPAPNQQQEVKYVELSGFSPNEGPPRYDAPPSTNDRSASRAAKSGEAVQYIQIDKERTITLEMMKKEREKELNLHMRPADSKSAKTLK